jgi:hypothetical protein
MNIICANCFSVCLRNRDNSITSLVPSPEILACYLWEIKRVSEYVNCDVLATLETGLLNEFMGTTGGEDNVGFSGDTVMSRVAPSVHYFQ